MNEILLDGTRKNDADAALLIDIGGGECHDLEAFHTRFPDLPGKLVLQDLPPTIESIEDLDPAIVRQGHDFLTPQPVKGKPSFSPTFLHLPFQLTSNPTSLAARAYYFRAVLLNWSDEAVTTILKHVAAAMEKGYSKLLIFDWVLRSQGVPLYPSLLDINMMAVLSGMERTEEQWRGSWRMPG